MTYDDRNERAIKTLDPNVQDLFRELLRRLELVGEDVLVTDPYRTKAEQDRLYAQGRTAPGKIVTNAKGGDSYHNYGLAADLAPVGMFGRLSYSDKRYEAIARVATEMGFQWGFQMWGFDKPHFQYDFGLSIADLKKGKCPQPTTKELQKRLTIAQEAYRREKGVRKFVAGRLAQRLTKLINNLFGV